MRRYIREAAVPRRTGGLEILRYPLSYSLRVPRRTGGLEIAARKQEAEADVPRRTGGLEICGGGKLW